ncbi:MAG: hypothetical protein E7Z63_05300 [Thermoplasmata archaeon]|jgi:hypothetical protein|nr:hypothetical protein [Thermoplasmata archaeon]
MTEQDPNAGLFGDEDASENEVIEYVFGKNPNRVSAITDLWYEEMMKTLKDMELPDEEAKLRAVFKLTASGLLDMIADSQDPEAAPDVMSDFDMFLAVALTNKKYNINLFAEQQKALETVDRSKFANDEEYAEAVSRAEDIWWEIAQPLLDQRNPNDAIRETLNKYGLTL